MGTALGKVVEVDGSRYRIQRLIAEGGFAFVFAAQNVDSGEVVALKRVLVQDEEVFEVAKKEVLIWKRLPCHPHIVSLLGAATRRLSGRESEVLMVMELCPDGHLVDIMNRRDSRFNETEVLGIFLQICEAVAVLHGQDPPITHRDLKIENVLLARGGKFKLTDFGSATMEIMHLRNTRDMAKAETEIQKYTTMAYRAPEMVDLFRKQDIGPPADIWALGCVLYKLCFYVTPFEDGGALQILNNRYTIPVDSPYSDRVISLIKYLLVSNPVDRPAIDEVIRAIRTGEIPVPTKTDIAASSVRNLRVQKDLKGRMHASSAPPTDFKASPREEVQPHAAASLTEPAGDAEPAFARKMRVEKEKKNQETKLVVEVQEDPTPLVVVANPVAPVSSTFQTDFDSIFGNNSMGTAVLPVVAHSPISFQAARSLSPVSHESSNSSPVTISEESSPTDRLLSTRQQAQQQQSHQATPRPSHKRSASAELRQKNAATPGPSIRASLAALTTLKDKVPQVGGDVEYSLTRSIANDRAPPKAKHVRKLIIGTWQTPQKTPGLILEFARKHSQLQHESIVAFKFLTMLHRVIIEGSPSVAKECFQQLSALSSLRAAWLGVEEKTPSSKSTVEGRPLDLPPPYAQLIPDYVVLLETKVTLMHRYPFFEGNYSLERHFNALIAKKERLKVGGQSVLSTVSVKALQRVLDVALRFASAMVVGLNACISGAIPGSVVLMVTELYNNHLVQTYILARIGSRSKEADLARVLKQYAEQFERLQQLLAAISEIPGVSGLVTIPRLPKTCLDFTRASLPRILPPPSVAMPYTQDPGVQSPRPADPAGMEEKEKRSKSKNSKGFAAKINVPTPRITRQLGRTAGPRTIQRRFLGGSGSGSGGRAVTPRELNASQLEPTPFFEPDDSEEEDVEEPAEIEEGQQDEESGDEDCDDVADLSEEVDPVSPMERVTVDTPNAQPEKDQFQEDSRFGDFIGVPAIILPVPDVDEPVAVAEKSDVRDVPNNLFDDDFGVFMSGSSAPAPASMMTASTKPIGMAHPGPNSTSTRVSSGFDDLVDARQNIQHQQKSFGVEMAKEVRSDEPKSIPSAVTASSALFSQLEWISDS